MVTGTSLSIETATDPSGAIIVRLIGQADIAGAEVLERQLTLLCAQKPARAVFDLSRLTFISSLCMGALMPFRRACDGWGGKLVLAGANDLVGAALRRARLDTVFALAPSVAAALHPDPSIPPD